MKPILGTAQFGLDYGVSNRTGKVSLHEANKIIGLCRENAIDEIDTAFTYGDAHKVLSLIDIENFKVNTKIKFDPLKKLRLDQIKDSIKKAIFNLKITKLNTIFIHNVEILTDPSINALISEFFLQLKQEGLCNYLGVSIYNYKDFQNIPNSDFVDVIQAPLNLFDQGIIKSGILNKRGSVNKIYFQARSVFLQGALLNNIDSLPPYFKKYSKEFALIEKACQIMQISKMELCIRFLDQFNALDAVVFGVESTDQFKETIEIINKSSSSFKSDFSLFLDNYDEGLFDPRKWDL